MRTTTFIAAAVVLVGCGAPATPPPAANAPAERAVDCVPDRWERPPAEHGQVPPDRAAPANAMAPFDGSGEGSGGGL